jgi:hypothetical protein
MGKSPLDDQEVNRLLSIVKRKGKKIVDVENEIPALSRNPGPVEG